MKILIKASKKIIKKIKRFFIDENQFIKPNLRKDSKVGVYGHLDFIDEKGIYGWFVNLDNPNDNELTIKIDGIEVGKVKPSFQREDINNILDDTVISGFFIKWDNLDISGSILNQKEKIIIEIYYKDVKFEQSKAINLNSITKAFIVNDKTIVVGHYLCIENQTVFLEDEHGKRYFLDTNLVFKYTRNDISPLLLKYSISNLKTGFIYIINSKINRLTLKMINSEKEDLVLNSKEVEIFTDDIKSIVNSLFGLTENIHDFINFAKFIRENILEEYLKKRKQSLENLNVNVYEYGEQIENPEVSIIIPIYKRFDFVEHQILEFIKDNYIKEKAEIIYILDDPGIKEAFETEIGLLYKMFRFPIKWIDGQVNRGFSGANNLGAKHTKGEHILFLNSDCIPKKEGWLKEMVELLKNNEEIGIVGCRLLYPDGSIQHAGMEFKYLKEWDVYLNHHPYLGLDPILDPSKDITEYPAVTGACMLMRKTDFEAVGGWDGLYLIGDFEDSDLCLKVNTILNKKIIYTPLVELTHLERQSYRYFSDDTTKLRITLYNAKRHYDKWKEVLDLKGTEF